MPYYGMIMIASTVKNNFSTITTVALFEFKGQVRTTTYLLLWLFIAPVVILNIKMTYISWALRCIPESQPYRTLLLANFIITVFSIIFTSNTYEDITRNKSNDVLFVRSFSNLSFILGKFLGLIYLLIPAVVFLLSITLVFNGLVFHDVNVTFRYYLLYPLLITLPVLFFTIGTNLLVMFIVRIKGLYLVLLSATYILFHRYLLNTSHGIFDFWGFNTPMLASDFIGMGNVQSTIIHRVIFLFWGLSCLMVCALMFQRLTQTQFSKVRIVAITLLSIASLTFFIHMHQLKYATKDHLRSSMAALNNEICLKPRLTINKCDIELTHEGQLIDVRASLYLKNDTEAIIDTCYFSLNPGLEVHTVECGGEILNFSRDLHILTVAMPVNPGSSKTLSIQYSGNILEEACYIDIDDTRIKTVNKKGLHCIDKRYSFITPDYVLLSHENLWYPASGVPFGSVFPKANPRDFVSYTLSVTHNTELTAISQGSAERIDNACTRFTPEHPLPQLSLIIGDYEKKSLEVDGIEYSIYVKTGHDFFSSYFNDIQDKLPELIRDRKNKFEFYLGLDYPYKRFSIVEVPLQFIAYQRYWNDSPATIQPEQVLIQEKGFFNRMFDVQDGIMMAEISSTPKIKTPLNIQTYAFNNAVDPFLRPSRERKINRYYHSKYPRKNLRFIHNYIILPNYYDFTNNFVSDTNPFFHQSIGAYLSTKQEGFGIYEGISFPEGGSKSDFEIASHVFQDQNLFDVCSDPKWNDVKYEALRIKNITTYNMISIIVGAAEFDKHLLQLLTRTRYKTTTQSNYYIELKREFNIDAEPLISKWYIKKGLASFKLTDVKSIVFNGPKGKEYNYSFTVHNQESVGGIFEVRLADGDLGGFPLDGDKYMKKYLIHAHEAIRIGVNFNHRSSVNIKTYISRNNPGTSFSYSRPTKVKSKKDFFIGEQVLENYVPETEEGVIVVDNTDPGFEVYNKPQIGITKLFKFHTDDDKIVPISFNVSPERWRHYSYNAMYGFPVKSFHLIKKGDGKSRASWNVDVPENGRYQVFSYRTKMILSFDDYHYIVHHDDGVDEVVQTKKASKNWHLIGIYNFRKGKHLIELTDESNSHLVRADAIKFVKVNKNEPLTRAD